MLSNQRLDKGFPVSKGLLTLAHQAYASGAGPPGPGNNSSSFFKVSFDSVSVTLRIEPFSCSNVRGPMIGAVTAG